MNSRETSRCLLLDGRGDDEPTLVAAHDALADGLRMAGWEVDDWLLRDESMAWCSGCFGCWVKTPGVCVHTDAGRDVAARVLRSDLLMLLTPVTFGGYSYELKKALDHILPNLLPFLRAQGGETRHDDRYERARDLLAVGIAAPGESGASELAVFRELVRRNSLNMRPSRWAAGAVERGAGDWETRAVVNGLLEKVGVMKAAATPGLAAAS